jgi:hypothetical protein
MRWYPKKQKAVEGTVPGTTHEWGPFKTFVLRFRDGTEERRIGIKLPVWGMYYVINNDELRWGQLTFQYCGQRGCFFAAVFPEQESTVDTTGMEERNHG